jgi:phosphatidylinositol alpha-1,6-mannosyltransferase
MIILLTNEFPPVGGGISTYCGALANEFTSLGEKIVVVAAKKTKDDLSFDEKQPFPIHRVGENTFSLCRHLARLITLNKYTKKYNPSLLWASDWRTGIIVSIIAIIHNIPYIVSAYGSEILLLHQNKIKNTIGNYIFSKAKAILCDSHYAKKLILEIGAKNKNIKVITLGVDPSFFRVKHHDIDVLKKDIFLTDRKVILTLARLTPRKGHDIVIKSLEKIKIEIPQVIYLIAGSGEDEQRLKQLVENLNLQHFVLFTNHIREEDKPLYYHACDVFAMISRQEDDKVEGFGLSFLEAAACGKPVVAGRHGGVEDAVIDGHTGILVEPFDVEATANALILLLTNDELAWQLGQNALKNVETEANWKNVAIKTLDIMRESEAV